MSRTLAALLLTALLAGLLATAALGAAKPSVSLKAAVTSIKVGRVLRLTGTVHNAKASSKAVLICKKVGGAWESIATAKLSAKHTFVAQVTPEEEGTLHLLAFYRYRNSIGIGTAALSNKVAITVKPAPGDWAAVACGYDHTLALKKDGSLWAWGYDAAGQLGVGDTNRLTPTQVGTANDWAAVACGTGCSLALKKDGSLWAWGNNYYGQLGLGDTIQRHRPTLVTGGSL
jgi:alpha-tubulin suppressor-like RCC1 family protein